MFVAQKGGLIRKSREKCIHLNNTERTGTRKKQIRKASENGWRRTRRGPCNGRQTGMEFGQMEFLGRVRTEKILLD